ncbi:hypothetical protein AURDEDRAFT_127611 [Auricularia subglabra TFB-10046 SS5]|nr:hypothetical protein AURDEDRAFT_127611 [Auricularia subglabra TFB-10046 SS5]
MKIASGPPLEPRGLTITRQNSRETVACFSKDSFAEARPTFTEMPAHWRNDFAHRYPRTLGLVAEVLFATLCLASVGHKSLEQKWKDMSTGEDSYREHMGRITVSTWGVLITTRLTTITVMMRIAYWWLSVYKHC